MNIGILGAGAAVSQLVADLGFEAVDSGGLARGSYGRNIGFRLVRGK